MHPLNPLPIPPECEPTPPTRTIPYLRHRPVPPPRVAPDPRCLCGKLAQRYDPDSGRSFCWSCSLVARAAAAESGQIPGTVSFLDVFQCRDGTARIDRDRMGGGVTCEECGALLYDHAQLPGDPWLTVLCDGSVAKL